MKKILIASIDGMISKDDIGELEKIGSIDWLIKDHITDIELANIAKDYDYLMLNFDIVENLTEEFYKIVKGTTLKVISTDITGMDWALPKLAKEAGIYLLNTTNYCTESVAEYSIMQILLYAKRTNLTYKDIYTGDKLEVRKTINLLNKTIGIIGLGNIGTRVAEIANGMGMNVIGYNHTPRTINNVEMVDLDTLFKRSDFISIHLKTVPGVTEGMITKDYLNLCKKECFIENQADSKLINKEDLINALKNNKISGYGATLNDFTEDLKDLDNVILFPANAWFSDESLDNLKNIWINNILEFDKGNVINLVEE
jgi:Phosphoglycerate dehydrogenase and related dehydrogenases